VSLVQAGERILFSMANGEVTAHIQIQYSGAAADFGWLLPLPSVPTLELGTDELFNQLINQTQPKYILNNKYEGSCSFGNGRFGASPSLGQDGGGGSGGGDGKALVVQDSIGPYDYAVLHADSKDAMLAWLQTNRYFVPTGTDSVVDAYIHPGAYFLALRLHSGKTAGDLQPVVVHYPSDAAMIPLVLTSVGAQPHMGIQVWMLGAGRAIPRNYYHTVLNDAVIDWSIGHANYNDVIIAATSEAPGHHSFVTEYAGTSSVMKNQLNYDGRFGSTSELAAQPNAVSFIQYLFDHGYGQANQSNFGPVGGVNVTFTSQLLAILGNYIPEPPVMAQQGVTAMQWYQGASYYLTPSYQQQNASQFVGWPGINYQPTQMAMDIDQRVVQPTKAASALFDAQPYLTRLYTTLSPEDMNKDPVFSYNPSLPDFSSVHQATLTYHCGLFSVTNQQTTPATLVTEQGWVIDFHNGVGTGPIAAPPGKLPYSRRIQILREEGAPEDVTDNSGTIGDRLGAGGCAVAVGSASTSGSGLGLLLLGVMLALGGRTRRRGR
jgi:MYXO-CTERM domain-containing protein